ncbi:hypothetical protein NGM10_13690 [Halorussus salilacus]|uniref:hypothetical protein n=1 Tax=Halorussus salilacus TaxID=2953750 RepID=UPI0020A117DE|nr:hypothetical protein [Halorussus salilacus]USZ67774.1 hypothetical protein NGM10_13690 [Halorussus salilacus]
MTREDPEPDEESAETGESGRGRASASAEARPRPELRWVQIRDPRRVAELGRNGRVVESVFREGDDAWEVLLVTYEGEGDERPQNR